MATRKEKKVIKTVTELRKGDLVMVIAGGNKKKGKTLRGQTGKILKVLTEKDRVIVEGLNLIKRRKRAATSNETSAVITREGSLHISNIMYYSETLKKPVRIKKKILADGRKVRGYTNPETKKFEQIDA